MKKMEIRTEEAPEAAGPYSQAIKVGDFIFASCQIPLNPETGTVVEGDIEAQTKQVFKNLKAVLASADSGFSDVVKTTVFLKNIKDFAKVNEIYAGYFTKPYPARSCIEVSALPKGVLIGVELIAAVK